MWGWLKPLLDWFSGFLVDAAKAETKTTDAKTTDETRKRFASLRDRIKSRLPRP